MKSMMVFNISTVQEVAPTQLYKKKHDTKISMVGRGQATIIVAILSLIFNDVVWF